jgi:hypothetical protein
LQEQLLREHDLLRGVREKHWARITTVGAKWRGKAASARTCPMRAYLFQRANVNRRADFLRKPACSRAFAASSRGDLYSFDLIQRA